MGFADCAVSFNSRGNVYFTCLSARSCLCPGERSVTVHSTTRSWVNIRFLGNPGFNRVGIYIYMCKPFKPCPWSTNKTDRMSSKPTSVRYECESSSRMVQGQQDSLGPTTRPTIFSPLKRNVLVFSPRSTHLICKHCR